jgi:hypothetical protein
VAREGAQRGSRQKAHTQKGALTNANRTRPAAPHYVGPGSRPVSPDPRGHLRQARTRVTPPHSRTDSPAVGVRAPRFLSAACCCCCCCPLGRRGHDARGGSLVFHRASGRGNSSSSTQQNHPG